MPSVSKRKFDLLYLLFFITFWLASVASQMTSPISEQQCIGQSCSMRIESGQYFVPKCENLKAWHPKVRMVLVSEVTFEPNMDTEVDTDDDDIIETIDSRGQLNCTITGEAFTKQIVNNSNCFEPVGNDSQPCTITNPDSIKGVVATDCLIKARVIIGQYRCELLPWPTSSPRFAQTTDSAFANEVPSSEAPAMEDNCSDMAANGTKYYLDWQNKCQLFPSELGQFNFTAFASTNDSQKASVLSGLSASLSLNDTKALSDFSAILSVQLRSNRDADSRTVEQLLRAVSQVANKPLWQQADDRIVSEAEDLAKTAALLVDAVDNIGIGLAQSAVSDFQLTDGTNGIGLSFSRLAEDRHWILSRPDNETQLKLSAAAPGRSVVTASLDLPKLIGSLRTGDSGSRVASRIVQASLFGNNSSGETSRRLSGASVLLLLKHLNNEPLRGVRRRCGYLSDSGSIVDDGCQVVPELSSEQRTACLCSHLSSFAVIVTPGESWATIESAQLLMQHSYSLSILTYACLGLSILCLLFTCVTYALVRVKSQAADHSIATLHRVHSCLSACMLGAHALFLAGFERGQAFSQIGCQVVSGATVYLFLAVFCWLLCEGFMYTKSLIIVLPGVDSAFARIQFRHYCLLSVVAPAVVIACLVAIRPKELIRYQPTLTANTASLEEPKTCWLSGQYGTTWAFLGPVMLICFINLIVFVAILVKLSRRDYSTRGGEGSGGKNCTGGSSAQYGLADILRRQVKLSVTLASLLGLTWLLSILFLFAEGYLLLTAHYLFVLLTGLQGCFIFFTQIAFHDRIREAWERRLLHCGGCLPSKLRRYLERRRTDRLSGAAAARQQQQQQQRRLAGSGYSGVAVQGSKSDSVSMAEQLGRRSEETNISSSAAGTQSNSVAPLVFQAKPVAAGSLTVSVSLSGIECACECDN